MIIRLYRWLMEEPHPCSNCDLLHSMLDTERFEKKQLLDRLLNPVQSIESTPIEYEPIPGKNMPWAVRRQMLEAEDRIKAKLMKESPKPVTQTTESLEKELGISGVIG